MNKSGERGQSTVELALVMPIFLILIGTAFQLALLFSAELALTNATRDGARWLAIHPDHLDVEAAATITSRVSYPLDAAKLTVSVAPPCTALADGRCASRPAGTRLSVTLGYDASSLWLFHGLYFPNTARTYTVHMRAEPR